MPVFGAGASTVVLEPDWEATINRELLTAWKQIAAEMGAIARAEVPVRTGFLRKSIRSTVERVGPSRRPVATLEATAPYAQFVEYGTRYMPPQPFLRPALDSVMRRWFGGTA